MQRDTTYFEEYGEGETVILLPSNWLTSYSYRSIAKSLAQKFHLIVPDLHRGKTKTQKVARTAEEYADTLNAFINTQKIRDCYLIGISFSCIIAAKYQEKYPLNVRKVLYLSPIVPIKHFTPYTFSVLRGITGYIMLLLHNLFSVTSVKTTMVWLYDALFLFLLKHPRQFFTDISISLAKHRHLKALVPSKVLLASKDEFTRDTYSPSVQLPNKIEVERISGYHAWFFQNPALLFKKATHFFEN